MMLIVVLKASNTLHTFIMACSGIKKFVLYGLIVLTRNCVTDVALAASVYNVLQ